MNKWSKLVALLLVLLMLGGCNLIGTDLELDAQTPVAQVNDAVITKGEAQSTFDQTLYETAYYYQMFGMSLDTTDESIVGPMREQALETMVNNEVLKQKAAELSLDTFTEEELAALGEDADAQIDSDLEYIKTLPEFADSELPEDELKQAMMEFLENDYGITKDLYIEDLKDSEIYTRMREEAIKDVTVTDEEVQALYDTRVADQQAKYEEDITSFATDFSGGTTIYYTPAGYRFIKHVLIKNAESTELTELQTKLSDNQTAEANLTQQLAELDAAVETTGEGTEEGADDTTVEASEEDLASRAALTGQLEALTAEDVTLQAEIDRLTAESYDNVLPRAQEVLDKATLGLNFDKLVESYGEDPGMQSEPAKSSGYPTMEGIATYDPPFQEAAMALENVGDISGLVQGASGYHILQYASDAVEGPTPLADVDAELRSEVLSTRQDEVYTETLEQWRNGYNVKTWPDKMK